MLFKFPKQKINQEVFDYESTRFIDFLVDYVLHSDSRNAYKLSKWLKEVSTTKLDLVAEKIPTVSDPDEQVIEVLKYIIFNLKYKSDKEVWQLDEYWQTPEESITKMTGDCEDGGILAYTLCRLKGIPANRLGLCAGDVNGGGHCWLVYKPTEYPLNFVILDWCYWPSTVNIQSRTKIYIDGQTIYEYNNNGQPIESNYYDIWFIFNEDWSSRKYTYQLN